MRKNMHADVNTMGGGGRDFQDDLSLKAAGPLNLKDNKFLDGKSPEEAVFLNYEARSIGVPAHLGLTAIESDIILDKGPHLEALKLAWEQVSQCGERWSNACTNLAECFQAQVENVVGDVAGIKGKNVGIKQEVNFREIEKDYSRARRRYYSMLLEPGVLPMKHPYRVNISEQNRNLRILEAAHNGEIKPVTLNTIADSVPFAEEDPAFLIFLSRHSAGSEPWGAVQDLLSESERAELRQSKDILAQRDIGPTELARLEDDFCKQQIVIVRLEDCADELNRLAQGNIDLAVRHDKLYAAVHLVEWCMSDHYNQNKYPLYNALPRLIDILHREYTRFAGDPESGNLINGEDITNMSTLAGFASEVVRFE